MELIQGTHKAPKFAPEDYISNMPDNVITHILNRLPIQEAVRTGTLSRNWRFKWNMLSQLIFDDDFFEYLSTRESDENHGRIIRRLLLHFEGAITKFYIYLEEECYDIEHWILFLSKKTVKDLTILKINGQALDLPIHFFYCLELKYLKLETCRFKPPASFHGFPDLLSLELYDVSGKLAEFFTQCPVIEILKIGLNCFNDVKPLDIAKFTNLQILYLCLCNLDNTMITSSSGIFELVGLLPKLHELELDFQDCKSFIEDDARKRFPITFPCLRALSLSNMDLSSGIMLSFAFEMIRSSPSLQTLDILARKWYVDPLPEIGYPEVDYNTTGLLQLRSVVFYTDSKNSEDGKFTIWLIKYLLACSPFLEKMAIEASSFLYDEKLEFATRLLALHRASPVAKINLY
ncbi:hypothetical protein SSX86_027791 [Deinandra increscens subsp. villosa]|uniref:F-box domain-containing protein n=1 Tax=Deinandra increscens subsp. villosa TaxID=3103831 RepID=A0AAP0GKP0_9ASTR